MDDDADMELAMALALSLEGTSGEMAGAPPEGRGGGHQALGVPYPVFRQPELDRDEAGNELLRVFVDQTQFAVSRRVYFHVVLSGESAWSRDTHHVDEVATKFYRANNSLQWKRTADVNYLFLQYDEAGRDVTGVGFPSGNFSSTQSFFHGLKPPLTIPFLMSNVVLCDDFVRPCEADNADPSTGVIRWGSVTKTDDGRPVIYLNTCNHLMHVVDTNEGRLDLHTYHSVDLFHAGTGNEAELYARSLPDRSEGTARSLLSTLGIKF